MNFVAVGRDLDMNKAPDEEEWMMGSMEEDEENNNGSNNPRKKLRLTKEQSHLLEQSFRQNHTLNPVHFSKFPLFFSSFRFILFIYFIYMYKYVFFFFFSFLETEGDFGRSVEVEAKAG